jgi:transcription antitermination factor NusA-like protein
MKRRMKGNNIKETNEKLKGRKIKLIDYLV